jgi:hypothetical protein
MQGVCAGQDCLAIIASPKGPSIDLPRCTAIVFSFNAKIAGPLFVRETNDHKEGQEATDRSLWPVCGFRSNWKLSLLDTLTVQGDFPEDG